MNDQQIIERYIIYEMKDNDKRKNPMKVVPYTKITIEELFPYVFSEIQTFTIENIKTLKEMIFPFLIVNTRNQKI